MNNDRWIALVLIAFVVSFSAALSFAAYLDHEKFKICLKDPRCEYKRGNDEK